MKSIATLLTATELVLSVVSYRMREVPVLQREPVRDVDVEREIISEGRRRISETTKLDMEAQRKLRTFEETGP